MASCSCLNWHTLSKTRSPSLSPSTFGFIPFGRSSYISNHFNDSRTWQFRHVPTKCEMVWCLWLYLMNDLRYMVRPHHRFFFTWMCTTFPVAESSLLTGHLRTTTWTSGGGLNSTSLWSSVMVFLGYGKYSSWKWVECEVASFGMSNLDACDLEGMWYLWIHHV